MLTKENLFKAEKAARDDPAHSYEAMVKAVYCEAIAVDQGKRHGWTIEQGRDGASLSNVLKKFRTEKEAWRDAWKALVD